MKRTVKKMPGGVFLAGDVGGTKTNVALFRLQRGRLAMVAQQQARNRNFPSLESILRGFLKEQCAEPTRACFGVAGPIISGQCAATNLPWVIDPKRVARALNLRSVMLLNDLEATAYGIQTLPRSAFAVLNEGRVEPHGAIAVIAAGTGLGEAALVWDGARYHAVASEGGHADFAPRNELEIDLLQHLAKRFGHVSYERVLSGSGKVELYRFLRDTGRGEEPAWLAQQMAVEDPSPVVSELGLSGRSKLCADALDLFVSIYGAETGNLALKLLARGGVYVGGGIAPNLLAKLKAGAFMSAFTDKGRLAPLVSQIPVRVILDEKTALFGAAQVAAFLQ